MKISIRSTVVLVAILASAMLLAGCGGTSKADYETEVQKIGEQVNEDLDKLDSGTPDEKQIKLAVVSLRKASDDIDAIDPPSEVKSLHEDLVSTLDDTADLLGRMAPIMKLAAEDPTKLGQDDIDTMTKITSDFEDIQKRMAKIEAGFKKKKYEVGLNTSD